MSPTPPGLPRSIPPATQERRISYQSLIEKPDSLLLAGISIASPTGATATPAPLSGKLLQHNTGQEPLEVKRDEVVAAAAQMLVKFTRDTITIAYLGLDLGDKLTLYGLDTFNNPVEIAKFSQVVPITAARTEAAQLHDYVTLTRSGTVKGSLGLDATDRLALLDGAGLVTAFVDPTDGVTADKLRAKVKLRALAVHDDTDNKLLGARGLAVTDAAAATAGAVGTSGAGAIGTAAGATPTAAEFNALASSHNQLITDHNALRTGYTNLVADVALLRTACNTLLARVRSTTGHGLIT